ncbi:hypothetical protein EGR_07236 [Echinococcus granulosus]|uniref:Uncharacterized protein n=1 Tax=Echinococcus granulosus TaxID=6210 RepID=W6UWL5_ECHGR|nr:hypothetical protein EGR_07236 [Echinococcus granulosus]EUB57874.1 hypothetical protein EGR_07236 [Echinococcus granulosus]
MCYLPLLNWVKEYYEVIQNYSFMNVQITSRQLIAGNELDKFFHSKRSDKNYSLTISVIIFQKILVTSKTKKKHENPVMYKSQNEDIHRFCVLWSEYLPEKYSYEVPIIFKFSSLFLFSSLSCLCLCLCPPLMAITHTSFEWFGAVNYKTVTANNSFLIWCARDDSNVRWGLVSICCSNNANKIYPKCPKIGFFLNEKGKNIKKNT